MPKSTAGQARFLYYDADEIDAKVESRDFDMMYQHNRSNELVQMGKENQDVKPEDEDEMTFGSRPPTAPEKRR